MNILLRTLFVFFLLLFVNNLISLYHLISRSVEWKLKLGKTSVIPSRSICQNDHFPRIVMRLPKFMSPDEIQWIWSTGNSPKSKDFHFQHHSQTLSVQWPRYASTILLLKPCIKIPKDMVQTSRTALLSFFQSQNFSTILFPIIFKRIFHEWLYRVNQACRSLTHFPLWETMVTENAFLRSSRGQPFRHWEEFRLRLRVLPAASKRGYSYGHQWSFITVFGLWAHMVVCRQFNAPSPCAPWHALSSKLGGQCEINAQIRWKQNL